MPTPSLNSFIAPSVFETESVTIPLYAAMLAGSTYSAPTFNGTSGAASNDPGGLFGWLIYARSAIASPTRGATSDSYILYNNYNELINDLNLLGGVTYCLVSANTEGGTFGFFSYSGNVLSGRTIGFDFLHALNYLSYGGNLLIAGSCTGFITYQNSTSNKIDVLIGQTASQSTAQFIEKNPYIIGIFPSVSNGTGYTAANFDSLFSAASSVNFTSGVTVANRIFNIAAQGTQTIDTSSLSTSSSFTYTISSVADVAGAFTRSKNNQQLPLTIAGVDLSTPLNRRITNIVQWSDDITKDIYKKNRVNFYSQVDSGGLVSYFLGSDLVGATAAVAATYTSNERLGPAYLKNIIEKATKDILTTYVFKVNNASTRASITTQIELFLTTVAQYIDSSVTQVICDASNNTDNSTTINASVTIKPILASTAFNISVSATA